MFLLLHVVSHHGWLKIEVHSRSVEGLDEEMSRGGKFANRFALLSNYIWSFFAYVIVFVCFLAD